MKLMKNTVHLLLGLGMFCVSISPLTADEKAIKSPLEKEIDAGAPELTEETSEAIMRGFEFLLTIQQADGSWRNGTGGKLTARAVPVGDTALVLLAFMVKGYFPGYGKYGDALDRGKHYLLETAKKSPDGYLGYSMYEHALATLAISEMLGMTKKPEDDEEIYAALEAAIKVILRAQDPRGSWTYTPVPHGGDTSISIMQLVALASARQAGIVVPDETIDRGVAYLESCQIKETGAFGYTPGNKVTIPCSAAAAYVLHLCGQRDSEMLEAGMDFLKSLPDDIFKTKNFYFYMHYYAMQAMVQDSDESYAMWYPKVRDSMLARQHKGTAKKGVKTSGGSWTGGMGGRAQSTAMAILTLGTPYRFLPIYQR